MATHELIVTLDGDSWLHQLALQRIEAGTYGLCAVCGKAIGDERLDAVPAARFCVEHQAEIERTPA